ncbi:hypothetical protein pipiens_002569 [Culex pipiens pipiens]|uniref:F-box domain-containing protein n=1 Tax=Culex pipiens pipiens TaxID=38569 RepID=A0ABD1DCW6_CULPP
MDTTLEPPFPTEIWEHIFRNCPLPDLKRFRLVCHRWNAIVTGCPALWRRFHVRFWPRTEALSPAVLPPVKQASFECNVEAVSSWWPRFAGKLEELAFDAGDVSITALFGMLKHCPNLKRLRLSGVWFTDGEVDYDFSLHYVEELSICDIYLNEIELPSLLTSILPCLKKFSLSYVDHWQGTFAINCWTYFIHDVQDTLQSLELPSDFFLVRKLCQMNQLQLKHVHLSTDCSPQPWDMELWITFCRSQQSLQDLILSGAYTTNEILCVAVQNLPNLKRLRSGLTCSRQIIPTFLNSPTTLQKASICGFSANLQFRSWLSPTLTELKLMCVSIGDGIQYLISSPNLVNLSLVNCDLSGCRVPKGNLSVLRHLKLSSGQISPEMLAYMLSCHPQLETAGFYNMESVDRGTLVRHVRFGCTSALVRPPQWKSCSITSRRLIWAKVREKFDSAYPN